MNISFCITVADEETEFFKLLNHLKPFLREGDEVLVKVDLTKVTQKMLSYIDGTHRRSIESIVNHWFVGEFKGNFSEWKNELIPNCKNPIIFFLDADELPNPQLLEDLPLIMELNEGVDIIGVPRINFVEGITEDYIKQMKWRQEPDGRLNWCDYQYRVMRNKPGIEWGGEVHETLQGGRLKTELPTEDEYALLHVKTFDKQKLQNKRYASGDYSK